MNDSLKLLLKSIGNLWMLVNHVSVFCWIVGKVEKLELRNLCVGKLFFHDEIPRRLSIVSM